MNHSIFVFALRKFPLILLCGIFSLLGIKNLYSQDLILNGVDTTMYGVHTFNNIQLLNGAVIRVAPYQQQTLKGKLTLRANNILVTANSWIDANGRGDNIGLGTPPNGRDFYWGGGGGGYGGNGGYGGAGTPGGNVYDTEYGNYASMGSNGSNTYNNWGIGGKAGAAILLFCDKLIVEGIISANGLQGTYDSNGGGGGGSGGGILLNCNSFTLTATGSITADGGNGGGGFRAGGGGGGGRIKIIYGTRTVSGKVTANAGLAISVPTGGHGQAGTIWYNNSPASPKLISPIAGLAKNNPPVFILVASDKDAMDKLFFKIEVSADSFKTIYDFYDQTISSKGWSKVSYNVGDTARYIPLLPLSRGSYQWRAYAYDGYVWSDSWKIKNPIPVTYGKFEIITTSVAEAIKLPITFGLEQNHPNPFNPSTSISYQLAKASKVDLVIYNSLGQEISRLVDAHQAAGYHTVNWDGKDHRGQQAPSGIYLYRLNADGITQTRKMLLVQ